MEVTFKKTLGKADDKPIYTFNGWEIRYEKVTPHIYSNWNIDRQFYIDHLIKWNSYGFDTLRDLKDFIRRTIDE